MQQLSRVIFRNSLFGVAAQVAIKLISFAFRIITIRLLGAESMGQYSAVISFVTLFTFISDLGLSPYTVREVARLRDQPDGLRRIGSLYGTVLRLRLALSVLAAVLAIGAALLTGRPLVMIGAIAFNLLGLFMYSVQGTSEAVLAGYERLDLSSKVKVINQALYLVFGSLVLWLGLGYYGLIGATLIGVAVMLWLCWRGVRALGVRVGWGDGWQWRSLLRASMPFGVIGFALGLSYSYDSVLLNIFHGDAVTGHYIAAYGLVFSAVIFSNAVNTALYPSLSRESVKNAQRLSPIYERCLRYLMILSLPMAVGGTVLAEPITLFLYGDNYGDAAAALRIIIWVVPLMFASEFLGYVVVISDRERYVARSIVISTALNIALNSLLVPRYGLYAASVMTVATEVVLVVQYLWLLRGMLSGFNWQVVLLRPLLAALAMGWAVHLLRELPVVVTILLGALVYGLLLIPLGVVGRDEYRFVRTMARRNTVQVEPGAGT